VLAQVATGADNVTIAMALGITPRTVKAHLMALYRKLGVENRVQLALKWRELSSGAASDARRIARSYFAGRGNPETVHLTEDELAELLATAFESSYKRRR